MKKLHLFMSIFMVVLLGFAAMAFGTVTPPLGATSVFDVKENWITRAIVQPLGGPPYVVKFEVIDPDTGNDIDPAVILTNGVIGLPPDITDAEGTDISLTFDSKTSVTYLIYTNSSGRQVKPYVIESEGPKIAVNPNQLSFGNLTTGNSLTMSVTVSNTGTQNLTLGTIGLSAGTNAAYTITSGAGGCASGVVLPSTNSCTITARFAPTVQGNPINGTLVIISDGGNADVSLTGSATAPVVPLNPDLTISGVEGVGGSYNAGDIFNTTVTVRNSGNAVATGPFTVKVYMNAGGVVGGTALGTSTINSLDPVDPDVPGSGVSTNTLHFTASSTCAVHSKCYFVFKVDANNNVAESSETNNVWSQGSGRAR